MTRGLAMAVTVLLLAGCQSAPVEEGGAATWALPPDAAISPDTTEFTAMVTERACASGRPSEGRVIGPDVQWTDDTVTVTFRVRALPGNQDCQGVPSTPVLVTLDRPLGDRTLLDGGREPPAEPPVCAIPESCE